MKKIIALVSIVASLNSYAAQYKEIMPKVYIEESATTMNNYGDYTTYVIFNHGNTLDPKKFTGEVGKVTISCSEEYLKIHGTTLFKNGKEVSSSEKVTVNRIYPDPRKSDIRIIRLFAYLCL